MSEHKELKEFIENWEINVQNKSARHKSGIGFNFEYENEDGSLRVEIEDLMPWERKMYEKYHDFDLVDKELGSLRNEFTQIYKEKMAGKTQSVLQTVLSSVAGRFGRN